MSKRICSVDGCEKPRRKREWCSTHYNQWRRENVLPLCSVDGCDHTSSSRGICNMHLKRLRKRGSIADPRPTLEQRFWSKVDKGGPVPEHRPELGPCWLWTAGINRMGYGTFDRVALGTSLAHRVAYVLLVGPIPGRHDLDHICYNPPCVNPGHLQAVIRRLNIENRAGVGKDNTSGVRGVYWHRGAKKWAVQAVAQGRNYYGGLYVTLAEAEAAAIELRNRVMTNNLRDRESA